MAGHSEPAPPGCPNGHLLGPGRVLVGWVHCACTPHGGHRTHECRECGAVLYRPPCTGPQPQRDRWAT